VVYLEHPARGAEEHRLGDRNIIFAHAALDVLIGKEKCKAISSAAVRHGRLCKGI